MSKPTAARSSRPARAAPAVETRRIMAKLRAQHPNADTELHYSNPYELLVATILSAQCTDERVNQVTPALFRRYPNAAALSKAAATELEPQIQSTGFFRTKSKSLVGMASGLVARHGGAVPSTMAELVELPGVGRKTANVVLGHALGVPGLPVDRHVLRVSNRIGIAHSEDPEVVEQQLCAAMPPAEWTRTSDTLILHGRRICKPRPLCDRCAVRDDCNYYRLVVCRSGSPKAVTKRRAERSPARSLVDEPQAAQRQRRSRRERAEPDQSPRGSSSMDQFPAAKPRGTDRAGGVRRQRKR